MQACCKQLGRTPSVTFWGGNACVLQVGSIESACQKGLKAQLPVFSEEVSQAEARKINGTHLCPGYLATPQHPFLILMQTQQVCVLVLLLRLQTKV